MPIQMRARGAQVGAALAVFAILLVISVATEIFMRTDVHPHTRFRAMLGTTLLTGLAASALIERMDLRMLA